MLGNLKNSFIIIGPLYFCGLRNWIRPNSNETQIEMNEKSERTMNKHEYERNGSASHSRQGDDDGVGVRGARCMAAI